MTLETLKALNGLQNLALVRRGNRLSVMPVHESEWELIIRHADRSSLQL
jgi:predicted RNA-binding protein with PUA-like domain